MKVSSILVALTLIVFGAGSFGRPGAGSRSMDDHEDQSILSFKTMVGVNGAFRGATNAIRGVNGAGAPWQIDSAKGELSADGELEVRVRGLVIVGSNNPVAFFRALVSCQSVDNNGLPITVNVPTTNGAEVMIGDPHNGNAKIEETISLPDPCIAPIVFVTSPGLAWFATTGNGTIHPQYRNRIEIGRQYWLEYLRLTSSEGMESLVSLQNFRGDRGREEKQFSRYTQDIRDNNFGEFNRRELLKMDLVISARGSSGSATTGNSSMTRCHAAASASESRNRRM